jgi:hypothetical protein
MLEMISVGQCVLAPTSGDNPIHRLGRGTEKRFTTRGLPVRDQVLAETVRVTQLDALETDCYDFRTEGKSVLETTCPRPDLIIGSFTFTASNLAQNES